MASHCMVKTPRNLLFFPLSDNSWSCFILPTSSSSEKAESTKSEMILSGCEMEMVFYKAKLFFFFSSFFFFFSFL